MPNNTYEGKGEVKDGVTFVYTDASRALRTPRHEFFHYLISKPLVLAVTITPYNAGKPSKAKSIRYWTTRT